MRTSRVFIACLLLVTGACTHSAVRPSSSPTVRRSGSDAGHPSTSPDPTASPSLVPSGVPAGTPEGYAKDVPPEKIAPQSLVPAGMTVTDAWSTATSVGETAGVAYIEPGDPLQAPRGLVIWRRSPGGAPPWRPVFGLTTGPGVLQLDTLLGDATGDGSDDALVFEGTGGSGACGTTLLLDLAANTQVFKKTACDTVVDFSPDPVGLSIRQAVYGPSDSHCCPSAFRATVLTYVGGSWVVAARTTTPT